MKKIIKVSLGLVLAFLMSFSTPIMYIADNPAIAQAATKPETTKSKVTLYVGYKLYQIKFENLSKSAYVTFKSSNDKVAKVNNTGIVTPIKKGSATVTVSMRQYGKTYTSKIKVTVDNPNIKITAKTNALYVGQEFNFEATAYGTDTKISWSVSNKKYAKIDKSGKLTALKNGDIDVIATAGNISSTCAVKISTNRLSSDSTDLTIYDQQIVNVYVDNSDKNESLAYDIDDERVVSCRWGDWNGDTVQLLIDPKKVGTTTVTISTNMTTDKLVFNVTVIEEPEERDASAVELSAKQIYEKCAPATAELQVTKPDGSYVGSGFFIKSGELITNFHVIKGASKIQVVLSDSKVYDVKSILAYDETYDIAVLSIEALTEHLTMNKGDVVVGDPVYALGSPQGLSGSLSSGMVSSASRIVDGVDYIQTTAPISEGNSGGPLLNAYGEVIGINTFMMVDGQNLNFATNIFQYQKLNFNAPMDADDFYSSSQGADQIQEDESKSGKLATAQNVNSGTLVTGTLQGDDVIDCFHITLSQTSNISAAFTADNLFDTTDYCIVDKDLNILLYSTETTYNGTRIRQINGQLSAGDYYVVVLNTGDYVNGTVNYTFSIIY